MSDDEHRLPAEAATVAIPRSPAAPSPPRVAPHQVRIRGGVESSSGSDDDDSGAKSRFTCPSCAMPDMSCLWRAPAAAFTNWISWSAGMFGFETAVAAPGAPGSSGRQPRYVRLHGTSSESIDHHHDASAGDDDDDHEDEGHENEKAGLLSGSGSKGKKASPKRAAAAAAAAAVPQSAADIEYIDDGHLADSGDDDDYGNRRHSGTIFGSHVTGAPLLRVSPEFEVWQKYLRDLANFAAVDVDTAIVPSSAARDAVPLLVVTIRGPIIPAIGRCRRSLDNGASAFIAPCTLDEWLEANPVRVMEVAEAFLLAVLAPAELVAGDDTLLSIIEAGTHILAMPAPALVPFLQSVAGFVRSHRVQTKVVLRDIDFTAEFDSARQALADRFLVLDTRTNPPCAREPAPASSHHGIFSSSILLRGSGGGGAAAAADQGSCPPQARDRFETDYSMLDIVRAVRAFARRVIGSVSTLRAVEIRGCMLRDSDLDVSGFLGGRLALFAVQEQQQQHQQGPEKRQHAGSNAEDDEAIDDACEINSSTSHQRRGASGDDDAFFARPGVMAAIARRLHGPARLSIEHCGLADAHLGALVRLVRLESERLKRGHFTGTNADVSAAQQITAAATTLPLHCAALASLSSLRISGQFMPMSVIGLVTAMSDAWEDAEKVWKRKVIASGATGGLSVADSTTAVTFPLRELEVPSSALHIVRGALDARLSSSVSCRSTE